MVVLGLCAADESDDEEEDGRRMLRVSPLAQCGVEVESRRRLSARKSTGVRVRVPSDEYTKSPPVVASLRAFLKDSSPEIRKALDGEREKWAETVRERQRLVRLAVDEAAAIETAMKNGLELPRPSTPGGRAAYEEAQSIRNGLQRLLTSMSDERNANRASAILEALPESYSKCHDAQKLREAVAAFVADRKEAAVPKATDQTAAPRPAAPPVTIAESKPSPPVTIAESKSSPKASGPSSSSSESKAIDEAKRARAEAQAVATRLESSRELKMTVCRALKKTVGAAINSVQNERASVDAARQKLQATLTDPLGRKIKARPFEPTPPSLAAKYPQHLTSIPEDQLIVYVRHYITERILERLLDDTFDHKRDVYALAALLLGLVAEDQALRRLIQGALLATSVVTIATPDASVHAERIAAFLAALALLDEASLFGGLPAAWTWLARYTNRLAQLDKIETAFLLPLVAFLELIAYVLDKAADAPFLNLLTAIKTWWSSHLDTRGPAATKFADLYDHSRQRKLQRPEALLTYLSS